MTYLKAAIGLTFGFIALVLALMIATYDVNHELTLAQESFLKGQYADSESRLNRVSADLPQDKLLLYKAYLHRQQGDLSLSTAELEQAFQAWSKGGAARLGLEIAINQALNAYLIDSDVHLEQLIHQLKGLPLRSLEWEELFGGILKAHGNNCLEALRLWKSLRELPSYSPWMQRGVLDHFPESWKNLWTARCYMSVGELAHAREILESLKEQHLPSEQREEVELLLGKSYLIEASTKPLVTRQAYYKSALGILSHLPLQATRFKKDRLEILKQIESATQDLVNSGNLQDLAFYTSVLQTWRAQHSLQLIAKQLMSKIELALSQNNAQTLHSMVLALNRLLPEGDLRKQLSEELEKRLLDSIQKGSTQQTSQMLNAIITLEGNEDAFRARVAEHLRTIVFDSIKTDNSQLTHSAPLVAFWEQIILQNQERFALAQELLKAAQGLWKEGEEVKALQLVKISSKIVPWDSQTRFQSDLETTFQQLYSFTLQQKRVTSMPYFLEAVSDFGLKELHFQNPHDIALLIDEANYLAANNREPEASLFVDWILTVSPLNQQALLFAGVLAYKNGDYREAEKYFSQLVALPKEALEPFAVSRLINAPLSNRQDWEHYIQQYIPTQEAYLRLALEAFRANRKDESLGWLQKVNPNTPEAKLVIALIKNEKIEEIVPKNYRVPFYIKKNY